MKAVVLSRGRGPLGGDGTPLEASGAGIGQPALVLSPEVAPTSKQRRRKRAQTDGNPMADDNPSALRANPFWTFSLELYSSRDVQQACLALQDESGVDVNILLYMLWLGANGRQLAIADVTGLLLAIEPWRAGVVVPLRTARRNLKQPPAAVDVQGAQTLRNMVKKLELEAERLQQAALFAWRPIDEAGLQAASPSAAAAANVKAYGTALDRQLADGPVGVMLAALETQLETEAAKQQVS